MKTILSLLILFFLSLFITTTYAQKVKSNLNEEINNKEIVDILTENLAVFPENTQVSIALIDGDKVTYLGVIKEKDTLKIIKNKASIFEIGSITKVFTSVLFSSLINQKKAFLTETLQEQFSFQIKEGGKITLQQLANHSSGLPRLPENIFPFLASNPNNPYKYYTPKLLEEYLKNQVKLKFVTGEKSEYSNLGVGLLGYILTKKTELSYEELLKKEIFIPLKIENSSTVLSNIDTVKLIKGRDAKGNITSNWGFTNALVGAGGIKSNVIDMVTFIKKSFTDDIVFSLPQKSTFMVNKNYKIGLSWHLLKKESLLFHNGGTGGYTSCLLIHKKERKSVVILSNISAFHKKARNIDTLCFQLLKTL